MSQELTDALAAVLDEGPDDAAFVPLMSLESGRRYGLDREAAWCVEDEEGKLHRFAADTARHFVEVLEHRRSELDDRLETGATAAGLPVDDALLSFPAVELVGVMLESGSSHFVRAGLDWLLPSELRELREAIVRVADDTTMPRDVREFARHLVVPEA